MATDYHVIAKPEGLWQSPGTKSVSAVQIHGWYREIATSALWPPRNDMVVATLSANRYILHFDINSS